MKDKDFDKLWNSGATAREYRQCPISDHELETIIGNAIERDSKTRKKHFPVWQKPYVCMPSHFSCFQLLVTPGTVACKVPLSMGFSRQEYWSG